MRVRFVFVGGDKDDWLLELERNYVKKIRAFAEVEVRRIKPTKLARSASAEKSAKETEALAKAIGPEDIVIACDERGEQVDSRGFSRKLVNLLERGRPRVTIVVGGPFGIGEDVKARADWIWSFSKLTLPHPLAQAVALEQTYRAFAIWRNLPYHND